MIYDTLVVERGKKRRCKGQSTDSRAETFCISQTKNSFTRLQGECIYYSQTEGEDNLRHSGMRVWTACFKSEG